MILGSLLHDIGHIIAVADEKKGLKVMERMGDCGAKNHENIGADFLKKLGFSSRVYEIARGHVKAKRFRCWKEPGYQKKLSDASTTTLRY